MYISNIKINSNNYMKTIITLFCMCFSLVAFSQTTVTGNVVDESQEPTLGANITVMGVAIGTSTDYDGNFTLTVDQELPFSIQISSIGYQTVTS